MLMCLSGSLLQLLNVIMLEVYHLSITQQTSPQTNQPIKQTNLISPANDSSSLNIQYDACLCLSLCTKLIFIVCDLLVCKVI